MDNVEEQQSSIHTMLKVDFQTRFLAMKNHLTQLVELLANGSSANINQRYHDVVETPNLSSSSNRVSFKVEAKVDIPTFGGEVDAEKVNNWLT